MRAGTVCLGISLVLLVSCSPRDTKIPAEIVLEFNSPKFRFLSGKATVVQSPAVIGLMTEDIEAARALDDMLPLKSGEGVLGPPETVTVPFSNGRTDKFRIVNPSRNLLVLLGDMRVQRKRDGKVVSSVAHGDHVKVAVGEVRAGVVEVVIPVQRVLRLKVLDREGVPAPYSRVSFYSSRERRNKTVTSDKMGRINMLAVGAEFYLAFNLEDNAGGATVEIGDSDEDLEVILQSTQ